MAAITCRGKVESYALRIVTDVITLLFSAIPSMNIVLHRGHPSRLPFGAQPRRGPDGTWPRCEKTRSGIREWQVLLWLVVLKAELSTLPDRNFLLCPDKAVRHLSFRVQGGSAVLGQSRPESRDSSPGSDRFSSGPLPLSSSHRHSTFPHPPGHRFA